MSLRVWLSVLAVLAPSSLSAKPVLLTDTAAAAAASETVVITARTRTVNVHENETVLFKVGAKQFAVRFDGNAVRYNLQALAPPGVLTHKVAVYVAPNPLDHEQGIP